MGDVPSRLAAPCNLLQFISFLRRMATKRLTVKTRLLLDDGYMVSACLRCFVLVVCIVYYLCHSVRHDGASTWSWILCAVHALGTEDYVRVNSSL